MCARCPNSEVALPFPLPGACCLIVFWRFGRNVEEPAESSSSSSSSSSSDSDSDVSEEVIAAERRTTGGFVDAARTDGGRREGTGEFAALRLAAISRNAATDMREASELTLFSRTRGIAGGIRPDGEVLNGERDGSTMGDSAFIWRKERRLNESAEFSTGDGEGSTFDFLRSRCAQENRPLGFLSEGGVSGSRFVVSSREGEREAGMMPIVSLGKDPVEREPIGSAYEENKEDFLGGGSITSCPGSDLALEK